MQTNTNSNQGAELIRENTSRLLSGRKRVLELARQLIAGLTRSELSDIMPEIIKSQTAKDFYEEFGLERAAGTEEEMIFGDLKEELEVLETMGFADGSLFDLQEAEEPVDVAAEGAVKGLNFKHSQQLDSRLHQSLIKMARLERKKKKSGSEQNYLNQQQIPEPSDILKSTEPGSETPEISVKRASIRDKMKTALQQRKYDSPQRSSISPASQRAVRGIDEYRETDRKIREAVDENYFDWMAHYMLKLNGLRKSLAKSGKLVLTPYVERIIEEVRDSETATGKIACLKGDLGAGKTEIALHVGREQNRKNLPAIKEKLEQNGYTILSSSDLKKELGQLEGSRREEMVREFVQKEGSRISSIRNLKQSEAESYVLNDPELLFQAFQKHTFKNEKVIDEQTAIEPILLSGHKEFDPAEMIGGFEIQHEELDLRKVTEVYREGLRTIEAIPGLDEHTKKELQDLAKSKIANLGGVETHAYLGKLFQAMQMGKTLIIDEFNAIPHEILIILNFYMTRRPGDVIQPPINNLPPFKVQEGFKIIFTGNIPKEGQTGYVGRQALDAAFRNRLNEIEVDYLPNSRDDDIFVNAKGEFDLPREFLPGTDTGTKTIEEAKSEYLSSLNNEYRATIRHGGKLELAEGGEKKVEGKENDELFQVLVTFGLPKSLVGRLPENYFAKVYQLARIARIIQDAYSGQLVDEKYYKAVGKKPQSFLKRGIASMRDLTTIIRAWKVDGYSRELDYYVWKYFIQNLEGTEQAWIYGLFKEFGGFFDDNNVFPQQEKDIHQLRLVGRIITDQQVPDQKPKLKTFSQQEVLENLFGLAPLPKEDEQQIIQSVEVRGEDLETQKQELLDKIDTLAVSLQIFIDRFVVNVMMSNCKDHCDIGALKGMLSETALSNLRNRESTM